MEIKKRKFFVFLPVVVMLFVLFILFFGFAIFFWINEETVLGKWIIVIVFVGVPLILFLWSVITFAPAIHFTDDGIRKSLLGIRLKKYDWKEIQDIKIISTGLGTQWLFFSKVNLKNHALSYCRMHSKTIHLVVDDKKMELIKKFIPKEKQIRTNR